MDDVGRYAESEDVKPSEDFLVRVRKNQASVSFTLNTKRIVERREIERRMKSSGDPGDNRWPVMVRDAHAHSLRLR